MKAYAMLLLLLLASCANHILISPYAQACTQDSDCTTVRTQCDVCLCAGEPVNENFVDVYTQELQTACGNITACDLSSNKACTPTVVKCIHERCGVISAHDPRVSD